MDDLTEEELRQIVSGTSNDWMTALQEQNPNWIMQAIQSQPVSAETGEMAGPIEGYTFYDPKKTEAGKDTFKRYDASGKLLGEQKFKEPGNVWDLTKQAAADLGPILQFTPLAPFVRAISAMSAAEQGNILGALASGLPLADKIPGLDKATVAALQSAGKYASVASAAKSKDPMQLLNALSQTKEFGGQVPTELKTISEYASKAGALQRAAKGDIGALMGLMPGAAKGSTAGQAASAGYGGADPGYFDPDAETSPLPDWALDPYKDETKPGDYYAGLDKIVDEWDEADIIPGTYDTAPKTSMPPQEMAKFLEANIDDPGTIDTLMQDYFPDLYRQTIGVTGTLPKNDVIIPDWDFMEEPDRTPGSPTDTTPGTVLPDDDRTSGTAPAGGTKTTAKPGMSTEDLMKLLLAMQGQRPEQEEEYRLANIQPLGYELMYGLRG